ncbi:NAD-dependent epimerase/dehydratase family protein [Microvirga sp. 2MCAF38]|uniref:NAD-dependent epimerase/dehydratase family protein n=1 Tax=Microvirga sp. 2MCAF38 TaxID=3232989 RepID=UPI003F9B05F6
MRAVVTGASGFFGRHLLVELHQRGVETLAVNRREDVVCCATQQVVLAGGAEVTDIFEVLQSASPTMVFHLAGRTSAPSVADLYRANVIYAANLLQAAEKLPSPPVVVLAGSAAEYGYVPPDKFPVSEDWPCRPATPYGITKLAQTHHGLAAFEKGVPVVVARLFNIIGPGMPEHLALGSFAAQIAGMGNAGGILRTGDLDSERDFLDVTEATRLIVDLAFTSRISGNVVNVCSGYGLNLAELTDALVRISGIPVKIMQSRASHGTNPLRRFIGDPTKIRSLGLSPSLPRFEDVLFGILSEARKRNLK